MSYKKTLVLKSLLILLLILIMFLPASRIVSGNRSHTFELVEVNAELLEDGSLIIKEDYFIDFKGSFSGMNRWIHKSPGMEVIDITVLDENNPFMINDSQSIGPPGTYFVLDDSNKVTIDWSFKAYNEIKTFTLRYKVLNAAVLHNDIGELYYKFFGPESESEFKRVKVTLKLQDGAETEQIRAWGHGPLHGEVEVINSNTVMWLIQPLPEMTMLEGRVIFPKELIGKSQSKSGEDSLERILQEEGKWAREANIKRTLAKIDTYIAPIVFLIILALLAFRVFKFKGEYKPDFQGEYYRELPANYTPAEMGLLWRFNKTKPEDLTATIMDLARRGYLTIEEITSDKRGPFSLVRKKDYKVIKTDTDPIEIKKFELMVFDFLFKTIPKSLNDNKKDAVSITFGEIETYTKTKKNRLEFASFWYSWMKEVEKEGKRQGFFDAKNGVRPKVVQGVSSLIFFISGIILIIINMPMLGVALIIGSVIGFFTINLYYRRTQRGVNDYIRWKAFRKFLLHFSLMPRHEIPSLILWEHFLVYAIPLGVAKEVIKQLQLLYPTLEENNRPFGYGWYYGTNTFSALDSIGSILTKNITQSIRTATSSQSSGSGRGGGFSGGGGGGMGGGGVGVR